MSRVVALVRCPVLFRSVSIGHIISSIKQGSPGRCVVVDIERRSDVLYVLDVLFIDGNHKRLRTEFYVDPAKTAIRWHVRELI